jgi:tetratricopeptide (TPR) repeat protein
LIASAGSDAAFERLDQEFREHLKSADFAKESEGSKSQLSQAVVQALQNYYNNKGRYQDAIEYFESMIVDLKEAELDTGTLAFTYNKVGMAAWSADDYEKCIAATLTALEFRPEDVSYNYNLALAYEATNQQDKLRELVVKLDGADGLDSSHRRFLKRVKADLGLE